MNFIPYRLVRIYKWKHTWYSWNKVWCHNKLHVSHNLCVVWNAFEHLLVYFQSFMFHVFLCILIGCIFYFMLGVYIKCTQMITYFRYLVRKFSTSVYIVHLTLRTIDFYYVLFTTFWPFFYFFTPCFLAHIINVLFTTIFLVCCR